MKYVTHPLTTSVLVSSHRASEISLGRTLALRETTMRARLALTLQAALLVFAISSLPDSASAQLPKRPGINRTCGCTCDTGSFLSYQYYTFAYECLFLHGATCNAENPDKPGQIRSGKLRNCKDESESPNPDLQPGTRPPGYRPPPYAPPIAEPPRRR